MTLSRLNVNGTVVADAKVLKFYGFRECLVDNRPCDGARVIDPASDREGSILCCSIQKKYISASDAKWCRKKE